MNTAHEWNQSFFYSNRQVLQKLDILSSFIAGATSSKQELMSIAIRYLIFDQKQVNKSISTE